MASPYLFGLDLQLDQTIINEASFQNRFERVSNGEIALIPSILVKVHKKAFFGLSLNYGISEESGSRYGIASSQKFTSRGLKEPRFNFLTRIVEQSEQAGKERGSWDLGISVIKSWKDREINKEGANRLNGRDILELQLAHGFFEGKWDFRSEFSLNFFQEGFEDNALINDKTQFAAYRNFSFIFSAQYALSDKWYLAPSVGFLYLGTQRYLSEAGFRELQAGTSSVMGLKAKYVINPSNMIIFGLKHIRGEYFIRSSQENFDGILRRYFLDLSYQRAF